jgi:hypothetical protein
MSMSTSTATRLLITISTETKPSRSSRKGDRLIKQDRENGSTIRKIAKAFPIGTRERQKNTTEQVAMMRSSQGRSFADGRTRGDKTLPAMEAEIAEASEIAAGLETEVGLEIAAERAVKEELAIAEVPEIAVAPATVEGRVIEVVAVKSPAVAGPAEAAPEAGPARLKASIAVVVQRAARASAAAPAAEALAAVGEGAAGAAAHEVGEAAEDDEDRSVPLSLSGFGLEKWNAGTLEHRRNVISAVSL